MMNTVWHTLSGLPHDQFWANTVLLLHGDGTNGSTTFTDSTGKNTITANGNAQISTTQSKFGGSSMYFDGNGDYLSVPASTNFNFGTGDHTLEAWIWWDGSYNALGRIIYATGGASSLDQFGIFSGSGLVWGMILTNIYPPINQWSHIAVSRQGTTVRFFINGVLGYTGTSGASIGSSTATAYIGYRGADGNHPWFGYIDDLRITKGVARYTSNFTPPTQAFPNS